MRALKPGLILRVMTQTTCIYLCTSVKDKRRQGTGEYGEKRGVSISYSQVSNFRLVLVIGKENNQTEGVLRCNQENKKLPD